MPCLGAALTAYIEATRDDLKLKNELCPPHPYPDVPVDWLRMMLHTMKTDYRWSREPDLDAWMDRSRLNPLRGRRQRSGEPRLQAAMKRYVENVQGALTNLQRLIASAG
jgi:hypothetical protein